MMPREVFNRKAEEMKRRLTEPALPVKASAAKAGSYNLTEAALEIGVSYSTARRILANEDGVRRYSTTTTGDAVIYPGQNLKRYQRVRMTYVIDKAAIDRVKLRMAGMSLAA